MLNRGCKHRYFSPKSPKSSRSSLFGPLRNASPISPNTRNGPNGPNHKPLLRRLRTGETKSGPLSSIQVLHVPSQQLATRNYIRAFHRTWTTDTTTPYQSIHKSDLTFEILRTMAVTENRNRLITSDQLKQSCIEIPRGNALWLDSNGTKLMQYLANFVPENLALDLEQELDRLVVAAPPKLPNRLARYKGFLQWRAKNLPSEDIPCGELRLLIYNQLGHLNDRPGPSADLAGQSYRTEAALEFRRSNAMTALTERLSRALGAIDKAAWKVARGQVIAAKKEWAILASADIAKDSCFLGLFVLTNTFTLNHLDSNDLIDGWAAMAVLGHFSDAPLYVPQLKAKLPHQRRDVVFLRAHILQHFSDQFKILSGIGRYVLVFTNHQSVFDYLCKHYQLVY